jgi:5-methylcytosine-specific restriction endonuclease McrA
MNSKYCSIQNHKLACKCFICKSKRGEFKGENNPNYGNRYTHTEETKQKVGMSLIGHKRNLGKKHSEETKKKLSKQRSGEGNPRYIDGRTKLKYPKEFNKELQLSIIERDGGACQHCGLTNEKHKELYKNKKLTIHHLDYNKFNSRKDNLIALCIRCNVKANKDREYWNEYYWRMIA